MSWFYLAFSSVVFFTFLNLLQRKLAVDSKNPRAMAVVFNGMAAILAVSVFFIIGDFKSFRLPTAPQAWIFAVIASMMYGIFERGRFYAAKLLDASVLTVIMNLSVLIAFAGSAFLYNEAVTPQKLAGAFLIITALILAAYKKKEAKSTAGLKSYLFAVFIATVLGLGWMLDKKGTLYFNPGTYNILVWTIPIIYIYFPYIKFKDIKTEFKIASWKVAILAFLNVVGYLLQLKALEIAEATKVIPIVQTSTLFTVLLGILILKEREYLVRKIIAGIIAVAGVFLLI